MLRSWRAIAGASCAIAVVAVACKSSDDDSLFHDGDGANDGGVLGETSVFVTDDSSVDDAGVDPDASSQITIALRDFRLYDGGDTTTDPDFENPPYNIGPDGAARPGYAGDWNDLDIVSDTLGTDGKPVYKMGAAGHSVTTHGQAPFNLWFRDTPGTNLHVDVPLVTTINADSGATEYDSNQSGQLYVAGNPDGGRGFFPLDDGTPYQTAYGNQGLAHNFSFTGEIHTVFTYKGGEYFTFRGDDDVWVYINQNLVMNLGGIHNPAPASVSLDTLGLTVGKTYPLDFFFAERHQGGSNVLFQTTIALRAPPVVK